MPEVGRATRAFYRRLALTPLARAAHPTLMNRHDTIQPPCLMSRQIATFNKIPALSIASALTGSYNLGINPFFASHTFINQRFFVGF
ncbi:MAG: hypothetical protein LUQ06_02130, partial [Methylococcaceae bacterium]|nr:hypothetical protein [Methylococcaceae bacterium]